MTDSIVYGNYRKDYFDLEVGDIVFAPNIESGGKSKHEVIGIYKHCFEVKKLSGKGRVQGRPKVDYLIGEVRRLER